MAVHKANIVLGRVALRQNDVEKAKACLLAAGHVHGDPGLSSFGPNMSLAKELLDRGERDTVVSYLQECESFWRDPQLTQWIQMIKAGGTPNFGANLLY